MLEKKKEKNLIFGILKLKMEYAIIVSKIRRKSIVNNKRKPQSCNSGVFSSVLDVVD